MARPPGVAGGEKSHFCLAMAGMAPAASRLESRARAVVPWSCAWRRESATAQLELSFAMAIILAELSPIRMKPRAPMKTEARAPQKSKFSASGWNWWCQNAPRSSIKTMLAATGAARRMPGVQPLPASLDCAI